MDINKSAEQVNWHLWASRRTRFINWIIDSFVIFVSFLILLYLSGQRLYELFGITEDHEYFLLLFGWMFLYYFVFEATIARTLGKLITRTKVVTLQGEKPTTRTIALRTLCRFVPFEALSAFRDSETCWHDDWTSTIVITTR